MGKVREVNARNLQVLAVIVSFITLGLTFYWVAWPLLNTVTVSRQYTVDWYLLALLALNVVPPLLLMAAAAEPDSVIRWDIHYLITILLIIISVVVGLALLVIGCFYCNTLYSGRSLCNDYRWCCVYSPERPELCPANSSPCVPPNDTLMLGLDLSINAEFSQHMWFALVFIILLLFQLGINQAARDGGLARALVRTEAKLAAVLFAVLSIALLFVWVGIVVLKLNFTHGYPNLAAPPGPGPFASTRYQVAWWFIAIAMLNLLLPYLFLWGAMDDESALGPALHLAFSSVVTIVSFVAFVALGIIWLFYCNVSWSGGSVCNDERYCCVYFAEYINLCPNTIPCPDGPMTRAQLSANPNFVATFVLMGVFVVVGIFHVVLNGRMRKYGVFYNDSKK